MKNVSLNEKSAPSLKDEAYKMLLFLLFSMSPPQNGSE